MLPWVMISVLSGSPFPTIALYVHDLAHYDMHMWRGCSSTVGQDNLHCTEPSRSTLQLKPQPLSVDGYRLESTT